MRLISLKRMSLAGAVTLLLLLFQNCGEISYVAPKGSNSNGSIGATTLPLPSGSDPAPTPSSMLAALSVNNPTKSEPVSGVIQLNGSAAAKWTKITVADAAQPTNSVSTSPSNGAYSVTFDTTKMADGIGKLAVTATSDKGEQKEIDLPLVVHNQSGRLSLAAINSGGPAIPGFVADAGFSGGYTVNIVQSLIGFLGNPCFDTARAGNFTYTVTGFPPNTNLMVALYFGEIQSALLGQRTFDVTINGTLALHAFDIMSKTGVSFAPAEVDLAFTTDATGNAVLQFTAVGGDPLLSAFAIYAP